MNLDKLGKLFVRLMPTLRGLVKQITRGVPEPDDALHEALVEILDKHADISEDIQEAEEAIKAAVVRISKARFKARNVDKRRFHSPITWHLENEYIGPRPGGDNTSDPVALIPDTRPGVEETILMEERRRLAAKVAAEIEADPGPRGQLYRLLYIDKKRLEEVARILGISYDAAKQAAYRLRRELREALSS